MEVTGDLLLAWCGSREWAPETRHSYYVSIRSFFTWWTAGVAEDPSRVLPHVRRPRGAPRPVPTSVLEEALRRSSGRDRLILCLAALSGLRAGEIARVCADDLVDDLGGRSLVVRGKGGVVRLVPLSAWLAAEVERACARGGGWAFPSKYGGHLSPAHVSKLGATALPSPWTLHTLRHRFATTAYRAQRDLLAVQRLLGHASVETTQRYAEPPNDALRRAVEAADLFAVEH
ncbi:tyrosine-type recombinase/integrase [Schaalia hyovaginalis]|uniref:tyrosine-type recombinase/integrase n=1 Tax=Schaalia hyovaginalis TaxID=29316 RepID=UPI0038B245B4